MKVTTHLSITTAITGLFLGGCGSGGSNGGTVIGTGGSSAEASVSAADSSSSASSSEVGASSSEASSEVSSASSTDASSSSDTSSTAESSSAASSAATAGPVDITDLILTKTNGSCEDFVDDYFADVMDIQESESHDSSIEITLLTSKCRITSNGIPNHDFNDNSANFASAVMAATRIFDVPRAPSMATTSTELNKTMWDAVMLNGVVLDLLSDGCYAPDDARADRDGNIAAGCGENASWNIDPLGTESGFGTDMHNAHTQPDGTYHYHGNPNALFDDSPGPNGSPVIGFAADGFPIYGTYFLDNESGTVRKALSGYSLKTGDRPNTTGNPGGSYDGTYIDDWEYTGAGDLDECNGMTVNGQYGYYVTESYPWVLKCFTGTPDRSFNK
jgi:hypothetical protein